MTPADANYFSTVKLNGKYKFLYGCDYLNQSEYCDEEYDSESEAFKALKEFTEKHNKHIVYWGLRDPIHTTQGNPVPLLSRVQL